MPEYCEVNFKIIFKQDIHVKDIVEKLSEGFNMCLLASPKLSALHSKNCFKPYSFSFPDEKIVDNIFHKHISYTIRVRSKSDIFEEIFECLQSKNNPIFYIEDALNFREVKQENTTIYNLVSLTPTIITKKDKKQITINDMDLDLVKKQIGINTIRKYNQFFNEQIPLDYHFIEDIQCINKKSMVYNYKNGYIIGNKYLLRIKPDEFSQKLSFTMLYSGIAEKNSLGLGFCYMKK